MREERIHRIEVHVGCMCFDSDKVLILKRTPSRNLFPDLWECGGGQVWPGESFEDAVTRELGDEAGVIAKLLGPVGTYDILVPESEQKKIPGMYFACKFLGYQNGTEPKLSEEHTEWRWQPVSELDGFEFIPGLNEQIIKAHEVYRKAPQ